MTTSSYEPKPRQWLPKPLERILEPFLERYDDEGKVRAVVEEAMQRIAVDPFNPGLPVHHYKGHDVRGGLIVEILDGDILMHYIVYADYPWLGLRAIVDRRDSETLP